MIGTLGALFGTLRSCSFAGRNGLWRGGPTPLGAQMGSSAYSAACASKHCTELGGWHCGANRPTK